MGAYMDKKNDNIAKKMYIKILIVLFSVSAVVAIGGRIVKQILRGYVMFFILVKCYLFSSLGINDRLYFYIPFTI